MNAEIAIMYPDIKSASLSFLEFADQLNQIRLPEEHRPAAESFYAQLVEDLAGLFAFRDAALVFFPQMAERLAA